MSACLEENEIVDFVMRNLEPEEAARAEAHIDTCAACRAVLIELARVFELRASSLPAADEVSHEDDPDVSEPAGLGLLPPELLKGAKVGRYMMLDLLGTGAMGVVFSAYDPELDRKVAVKVLRDRSGNEERNARMVREARATARLAHPNVVVVHDVGEFEGNVFMAMELVTGGTLGDWIRKEERTRNALLDAFIEAGEGLAAAHDAGLVHRDFKPANVLMGENGRPRVTDFGLARAGDATETTQETLSSLSGSLDVAVTKTGALVGTPAYMSPEQFEGRVADARSDQFSFCVALAEALCGERPFAGKSLMELQATVCAGTLRPGALDGLPRPLQAALQVGLRLRPEERHADMHTLLRALRGVRRSSPAKTWTRVGLLAMAVLGGAGAAWVGSEAKVRAPTFETCKADAPAVADVWTPATRRELEATIASIGRPAAARIARSVVVSLDTYAAGWDEVHAQACASESEDDLGVRFAQLRCLDRGRVELGALLEALGHGDDAVLEHAEDAVRDLPQPNACATPGWRDTNAAEPPEAIREEVERLRIDFEVAAAYLATGQYALAVEHAGPVADAAKALGYEPLVVDALLLQAEAASMLGHQDQARTALQTAWADAIRGSDPRSQLRVASTMIDVVGNEQHERDDGEFWVDVALAALEGVDDEDPVAWEYWNALAKFRAYEGKYDEALEAMDRALAVPGISDAQVATTKGARLSVASLHAGSADQEKLLQSSRALAQGLRDTLGPDHPRNIATAQNLSAVLTALGRGEEALVELDDAMRIAQDVLADNDVRFAGLLASRASARYAQGDLEGARADSARVVEIRKATGADDAVLGLAYNNLAVMDIGLHHFEAAIENLELALPLMEAGFGEEHVNVANVHTSISSSLIALERYEDARSHLERAKAIASKLGPITARLDPIIALNLARVELHAGNLEAATTLSEEGVGAAEIAYGKSHPLLAKFIGVEAKLALAKGRPAEAVEAAGRGLELAKDPVTQAVLEMIRARGYAAQGDAVGCVRARDAARGLDAMLVDDPC